MVDMNVVGVMQWLKEEPALVQLAKLDVDTGRRTTPEKWRTKQEPAQASVITWLSEASDEKRGLLRPAKIRAGWRSTSGFVAPPSVRHLVAPLQPTRHFAVQQLQHAHMTNSMPSVKVEREIKPALRSVSSIARRRGQWIAFEVGAKLCQTRWFEREFS
mmetsp:Transcript_19080/g.46074  ORF Transcript_19080/g.46074 Transcript_19080/m.46074 type:complete len:159 (+) Transcript_19080:29-505(+)